MKSIPAVALLTGLFLAPALLWADDPPSAEDLARKAQDPLADVRAIMTDNTIALGTADDEASYSFQIQPVYSIPTVRGYNWIARAVIPIIGAPAGAGLPRLGNDPLPEEGTTWGLSDTMVQLFWTPKTDADVKWGAGPQVSMPTATSERVAGAGWGAGLSAVVFGFSGSLAYGALVNHHWGQDDYSVSAVQPILYYNIDRLPGVYAGYNNTITYNWNADSENRWQVPVGLTTGKTFGVGSAGHAMDLSLGGYWLAEKPEGGADWQLKFGVSLFFP